ncbi:hypothetical protein SCNU_15534 [Gordonia neofelifaecis NRRL B-59395]|uniref:Uncharacterized protein n=1 Tax=Gordonia neofelifaecis NRRL B-59395 TaxID=644548 RepID=F1YM98_9ACTN|nr:hypothetical protein SCNU_15534 [Gordonia neofelifaecis NRRL B-59395]
MQVPGQLRLITRGTADDHRGLDLHIGTQCLVTAASSVAIIAAIVLIAFL